MTVAIQVRWLATRLLGVPSYTETQECKNVCDNKIVTLWKLSPSLNQGD